MVSIQEFCERLVGDFHAYFHANQSPHLLTQSKASCKAIIKRCIDFEPDYVVDIGTNYGLSALSLAYSMRVLGSDLSLVTTTDIDQSRWTVETPEVQRGLLMNCGIGIGGIRSIEQDFMSLDPGEVLKPGRALIFYDIHDTDASPFMDRFIRLWLSRLGDARVLVHDFYRPHSGYYIDRHNPICPVSTATHFSGMLFEGYRECRVLIDWMNSVREPIRLVGEPPIIEFGS